MLKIVLILLIAGSFLILHGQYEQPFGFKSGCVISDQNFEYTHQTYHQDTEKYNGFDFCSFVEYYNESKVSLLVEFHYIQKGMALLVPSYDEHANYLGKKKIYHITDYFSLPFLAKYKYEFDKITPYVMAGPALDIKLQYITKYDYYFYNEFNKVDIGCVLGMGIEFKSFLSQTYLIEFRYSPTLTSSYKSSNLTVRTTSCSILAGMKF
jgi:Outer membrane protein beta-barrel domain